EIGGAVEGQRSVGGADKAAEIRAHAELYTQVAGDRAEIGPAAAADLDPRDGFSAWREVDDRRRVDLDLTCRRPRHLAAPRQTVGTCAGYLHRRVRRRLLRDLADKSAKGVLHAGRRQVAGVTDDFAL